MRRRPSPAGGRSDRLRQLWNAESHKYADSGSSPGDVPLRPEFLPRHADRVLDAGCGGGAHVRMYRTITPTVVGLDFSDAMVRAAGRHTPTVQGDIQALPFRGDAFDYVSSYLVISHVPDSGGALGELGRVTRPGGRLVVVVPNRWSFLAPMRALMVKLGRYSLGLCRHYSVSTLRREGRAHGLAVVAAHAVRKPPTALSAVRAGPTWIASMLDRAGRAMCPLWGGDLAVMFEKRP